MTVYVDEFPPGWGRWTGGGHMLASNIDELHELARCIGLKRAWFQDKGAFAHYDLTKPKRQQALNLGAAAIEIGEVPDDVLMNCRDGDCHETYGERMARGRAARAVEGDRG